MTQKAPWWQRSDNQAQSKIKLVKWKKQLEICPNHTEGQEDLTARKKIKRHGEQIQKWRSVKVRISEAVVQMRHTYQSYNSITFS